MVVEKDFLFVMPDLSLVCIGCVFVVLGRNMMERSLVVVGLESDIGKLE